VFRLLVGRIHLKSSLRTILSCLPCIKFHVEQRVWGSVRNKNGMHNWSTETRYSCSLFLFFLSLNLPILWSGSFVTIPTNLLVHIMLAYLMDPVHAENTACDQHKLRHTSLRNNSIELRTELQSCPHGCLVTSSWVWLSEVNGLPSRSWYIPLLSHERRSTQSRPVSWNSQNSELEWKKRTCKQHNNIIFSEISGSQSNEYEDVCLRGCAV
jgi:hypothetical protein